MTLVTVDNLSEYLSGAKIDNQVQRASAQMIIDGVVNELEMYINRPLTRRATRQLVKTDQEGFARLYFSPVHSVTKVSFVRSDGYLDQTKLGVLSPGEFTDPLYETVDMVPANMGQGLIRAGGIELGAPNSYFVVEYVGGGGEMLDHYLPSIRLGVLRVAAREWQHMHDDTMKLNNGSVEEAVDFTPNIGKGWSEQELAKFDRIRRRSIA